MVAVEGNVHSIEDVTPMNLKQSNLMKLNENFTIIENDIIISKVRVLKPKKFKVIKTVILPTLYSTGQTILPEMETLINGRDFII